MSAKIKTGFDEFASSLGALAAVTAGRGDGEPPGLAYANAELICNVRDLAAKLDNVAPAIDAARERISKAEDGWARTKGAVTELQAHARQQVAAAAAAAAAPSAAAAPADPWFGQTLGGGPRAGAPEPSAFNIGTPPILVPPQQPATTTTTTTTTKTMTTTWPQPQRPNDPTTHPGRWRLYDEKVQMGKT